MRTEFVRWGNSLALRIPSAFAKEVGATEGRRAEMTIENGAIVIKVDTSKKKRRRRYTLEQLLEQMTKENSHPEIDWGPPVGNEVW